MRTSSRPWSAYGFSYLRKVISAMGVSRETRMVLEEDDESDNTDESNNNRNCECKPTWPCAFFDESLKFFFVGFKNADVFENHTCNKDLAHEITP